MTDQPMDILMGDAMDDLARELREADKLEQGLDRALSAMTPPLGATQRLMAQLGEGVFHESQLTLDDAGPYSFEQAVARAKSEATAESEAAGSDLLAAGLEEQDIEDEDETADAD